MRVECTRGCVTISLFSSPFSSPFSHSFWGLAGWFFRVYFMEIDGASLEANDISWLMIFVVVCFPLVGVLLFSFCFLFFFSLSSTELMNWVRRRCVTEYLLFHHIYFISSVFFPLFFFLPSFPPSNWNKKKWIFFGCCCWLCNDFAVEEISYFIV